MIASFGSVEKSWIKNQYGITYVFTINSSSRNSQNSEKKFLSGRLGIKNSTHPRTRIIFLGYFFIYRMLCVFRLLCTFLVRNYVHSSFSHKSSTTWKLSIFGVFLVHVFPHLGWIWSISPYSVQIRENTEQKNTDTDTFHEMHWIIISFQKLTLEKVLTSAN